MNSSVDQSPKYLRAVIQKDRTGCGIASVAALAGVSYMEAKNAAKKLGITIDDPRLWSDTRAVRRLLKHFAIQTAPREKPFRSWRQLPALSLLAIKWHREKGKPYWHWVVFVRHGEKSAVLDSKKALRRHCRTDFGRIKPKWSIELKAPQAKPQALGF